MSNDGGGITYWSTSTVPLGTITFISTSPVRYISTPVLPELKATEVIAGEITAWRVWWVYDLSPADLRSVAMPVTWTPGEPMKGNPSKAFQGVHAYKTKAELAQHYALSMFAYGEVELWGDVIEHKLGYRAEFARIKSIYHKNHKLQRKLRQRYLGEQPQSWLKSLLG